MEILLTIGIVILVVVALVFITATVGFVLAKYIRWLEKKW